MLPVSVVVIIYRCRGQRRNRVWLPGTRVVELTSIAKTDRRGLDMWMRDRGLRWRRDAAEAGAEGSGVFLTTLGGVAQVP